MEKSFNDSPSQIFDLDEKDPDKLKKLKRDNKIKSILND